MPIFLADEEINWIKAFLINKYILLIFKKCFFERQADINFSFH